MQHSFLYVLYLRPFDLAQRKPFDPAQDKPFDPAQDKPFDLAQGKQAHDGVPNGVATLKLFAM